jgi:hypothetical protein
MYGKVKEASMLSVEQLKEKEFGAPTLFQNIEGIYSSISDSLCGISE